MTWWPRGGYAAGNTPASELNPPPESMCSKTPPDRWLDLNRVIAIKWGDKIIDPAEVVYVLREAK